jgi:hypothetical protein
MIMISGISFMQKFRTLLALSALLSTALSRADFNDEALSAKTNTPIATKAPHSQPSAKKSDKKQEAKKPEKFEDEKPFDEIVKNMEVIKGLFTFYRKADENKIYLEITTNQFEKLFLFSSSIDSSVGEKGLYASQQAGEFPFTFHLVGKQVQMSIRNSLYTATNGTPESRGVAKSFPNSLLASTRILSRPHPERKSLLVNAYDLFVLDLPGFAPALSEIYRPSGYHFDRGNSGFGAIKSFPENALIEVDLHFATDNPRARTLTLPDARSLPIVVKYDLAELKQTDYKPRLADDRVGHFLSVQADYSTDHPKSLMVRRINRWNLQKKDPKAAISEPVKPITYWLENTIPVEYRPYIREGVLMWNKAFERIGFTNAVVVRQQPDNAEWDPADARYSTIRWFQGADAGFAIGPSRANPFTGEIYDADIGFSEAMARYVRRFGEEFAGPISGSVPVALEPPAMPKLAWSRDDYHGCEYASGMIEQAQFGVAVLQARGALSKDMEEKLLREYLVEVTAHEVGHTLGLRHNFRASNMLKPEDLLDDTKTDVMSQSGSVMDYNPIVIAPKGQKQGHFCPPTLGPYDYWAIEYAYKPIEGDEEPVLAKIASRCAEPELGYATDEDALGTLSPASMDPMVNQFDQSSDPIGFYTDRIKIVRELWTSMEENLLEKGEGYQILRRAMNRGFGEYSRGILIGAKFIGGVYHRRDHYGDPHGRAPYAPVSAEKQREALEFLQKYAFAENAFDLPPTLLNRLAMERLPGVSGIDGVIATDGRNDYAWVESILNLHRAVLGRLYQPLILGRLQDNEMRFAPGEQVFTMADMFAGLDASIWTELDGTAPKISPVRRNLQREHLKQLVRLTVRNVPGIPEDATSLARASLSVLSAKMSNALNANRITDPTSRAHLQESIERVKSTLDARLWKNAE